VFRRRLRRQARRADDAPRGRAAAGHDDVLRTHRGRIGGWASAAAPRCIPAGVDRGTLVRRQRGDGPVACIAVSWFGSNGCVIAGSADVYARRACDSTVSEQQQMTSCCLFAAVLVVTSSSTLFHITGFLQTQKALSTVDIVSFRAGPCPWGTAKVCASKPW